MPRVSSAASRAVRSTPASPAPPARATRPISGARGGPNWDASTRTRPPPTRALSGQKPRRLIGDRNAEARAYTGRLPGAASWPAATSGRSVRCFHGCGMLPGAAGDRVQTASLHLHGRGRPNPRGRRVALCGMQPGHATTSPTETKPPPRPERAARQHGRPTGGARNPGPQNASRGMRDCSWSLWRPQVRASQASCAETSPELRQRLAGGIW